MSPRPFCSINEETKIQEVKWCSHGHTTCVVTSQWGMWSSELVLWPSLPPSVWCWAAHGKSSVFFFVPQLRQMVAGALGWKGSWTPTPLCPPHSSSWPSSRASTAQIPSDRVSPHPRCLETTCTPMVRGTQAAQGPHTTCLRELFVPSQTPLHSS